MATSLAPPAKKRKVNDLCRVTERANRITLNRDSSEFVHILEIRLRARVDLGAAMATGLPISQNLQRHGQHSSNAYVSTKTPSPYCFAAWGGPWTWCGGAWFCPRPRRRTGRSRSRPPQCSRRNRPPPLRPPRTTRRARSRRRPGRPSWPAFVGLRWKRPVIQARRSVRRELTFVKDVSIQTALR